MGIGSDKAPKDEAKGFSGLASMVSDIGEMPVGDRGVVDVEPIRDVSDSAKEAAIKLTSQPTTSYQDPPISSNNSFHGKWAVGVIALVVGLVWLVSTSEKKHAEDPPTYAESIIDSSEKSEFITLSPPTSDVQILTKPSEEMPPVGSGFVLSLPQIRYCTAEGIRIDAAKGVLNQYSDTDITHFNSLVNDYNSRCGSFSYRSGSLESARSEVEKFRSEYEAEGRKLFASSSARPLVEPQTQDVKSQPKLDSPAQATDNDSFAISHQEEESIEVACSTDKYLNGPAAYRSCREQQAAALRNAPKKPDLSGLTSAEHESIEAACVSEKYLNGPATYNRCLTKQLNALSSNNQRPSLGSLSEPERESVEAACSSDKYLNGPAAYNNCLSRQIRQLR